MMKNMSRNTKNKKKKKVLLEKTIAGYKTWGSAADQMRRNKALIEAGYTYAGHKPSDYRLR